MQVMAEEISRAVKEDMESEHGASVEEKSGASDVND